MTQEYTYRCSECHKTTDPYYVTDDSEPVCAWCREPLDLECDRIWMCDTCGVERAVCDDSCVRCTAEYYIANQDDLDPNDKFWREPHWRDAMVIIRDRLRPAPVSEELKGAVYALTRAL